MIEKETKYSYRDLFIKPTDITGVRHRSECILPEVLPLFTAPMDSVVCKENYQDWKENGIIPILPRTFSLKERLEMGPLNWIALGLEEFETTELPEGQHVLIDIANGHMKALYDAVKEAKLKDPSLVIMVGNIANPETFLVAEEAGVDYIRVGIGAGQGCITASNVSVSYPMASLVNECYRIKKFHGLKVRIVADGGVRNYSDAIKALALGADYVMIGSVFAKMLESAGKFHRFQLPNVIREGDMETYNIKPDFTLGGERLEKIFYGMASRQGQIAMNGSKTKTSEGIMKLLPVEYTMRSWVNNFRDYLRSAMSYTGHKRLQDFIGEPTLIVASPLAVESINR